MTLEIISRGTPFRLAYVAQFMLYGDLDGLKEINNILGHQKGDCALIDIANILKETFRGSDIIARLGRG